MNWIEKGRLILAPMTGISSFALRQAFSEAGWFAGWIGSLDSRTIAAFKSSRLINLLGREERIGPRPSVLQLLGDDTDAIRGAMDLLHDSADAYDINLGCPLEKATKRGMGGALLHEPEKMISLLRAAARSSGKPVMVKVRLPETGLKDPAEWARRFEDTGVAALVIHARKPSQGFRGRTDWASVLAVKKAVSIPVIANGGLRTAEDIRKCFQETTCDAVMIGQGALFNPFLTEEHASFLEKGCAARSGLWKNRIRFARIYSRHWLEASGRKRTAGAMLIRSADFFALLARSRIFALRHSL